MNDSSSSRPQFRRAAWLAGLLALAGVFAGLNGAQDSNPAIALKHDNQPVTRGQLERASFSDVVKRVSPSVVKITTETRPRATAGGRGNMPGMENPLFREFFGNRNPEMRQAPQAGLGSGVVISADGYIATNNHVIDGADTVTVAFTDGREMTAKVVGRDPQTDIAVIKVDAEDLPAVTFANTTQVEVGDRVLAIGNPFGIGETVTSGIVSAKGRRVGILADVEGYEDFIQTDAAINPGNSGGALVDVEGRLIGINTAILSRSGGFQGVGLAVPSNMVSHVVDSLVRTGKVVRGYLGVSIQSITPALAQSFGLKNREGALVAEVVAGSPADKAGLESGDVIVGVNGMAISDANNLTLTITAISPGTKLDLSVLRDGEKKELTAVAVERPGSSRASRMGALPGRSDSGVLNGVALEDLDRNARQQLNLPPRLQGALVARVEPESAAARAGIRAGDVILEINRRAVSSAEEALELSAAAEGGRTLLRLWSRGSTIFVVVEATDGE